MKINEIIKQDINGDNELEDDDVHENKADLVFKFLNDLLYHILMIKNTSLVIKQMVMRIFDSLNLITKLTLTIYA